MQITECIFYITYLDIENILDAQNKKKRFNTMEFIKSIINLSYMFS